MDNDKTNVNAWGTPVPAPGAEPAKTVIGALNTLRVVKQLDFGIYLNGHDLGEILMPKEYVPAGCELGDEIEAFIYLDSEDRLVATTKTPKVMLGELAYLKAIAVNETGAFLDWGLPKDLMVPFKEQKERMVKEKYYRIFMYLDAETNRLVATSKVHKHVDGQHIPYKIGDQVDLVVTDPIRLGHSVIIDKHFVGAVYANEVFRKIQPGHKLPGFIKKIRDDGKIDVVLQKTDGSSTADLPERIMQSLRDGHGKLPITDKSDPDLIYRTFRVSKKAYKRAVGLLYKQKRIIIEPDCLRLK